jgi:hypothetical protein
LQSGNVLPDLVFSLIQKGEQRLIFPKSGLKWFSALISAWKGGSKHRRFRPAAIERARTPYDSAQMNEKTQSDKTTKK